MFLASRSSAVWWIEASSEIVATLRVMMFAIFIV
jgi:hypothetical protein